MVKLNASVFKKKATSTAFPLPTIASDNPSLISLDSIAPRIGENTREPDTDHVIALADSIAVLGLIHPIVVDAKNRLVAGGNRQAAIAYLRQTRRDIFDEWFLDNLVPVHRMAFDSALDPGLAFQCEVAENEHRKDYTKKEILSIAARLESAGYVKTQGRPKKGQKPLMPALKIVIGKSIRQIERYFEPPKESTTYDVLLLKLRRVEKNLSKAGTIAAEIDEDWSDRIESLAEMVQELFAEVAGTR